MKKFYDREKEKSTLLIVQQQAYADSSRFVVLTGRRRVGKTRLVYNVMEETKNDVPGLYFFVGRKVEGALVQNFVAEASGKLGEYIPDSIRTFRDLFRVLLEIAKRRHFTLFIDEFQEFDNVNSAFGRHPPGKKNSRKDCMTNAK